MLNARAACCSLQIGRRIHRTLAISLRMEPRSFTSVTVFDGEIAEMGSFVGLGRVRNPRTDLKHGYDLSESSRFNASISESSL